MTDRQQSNAEVSPASRGAEKREHVQPTSETLLELGRVVWAGAALHGEILRAIASAPSPRFKSAAPFTLLQSVDTLAMITTQNGRQDQARWLEARARPAAMRRARVTWAATLLGHEGDPMLYSTDGSAPHRMAARSIRSVANALWEAFERFPR